MPESKKITLLETLWEGVLEKKEVRLFADFGTGRIGIENPSGDSQGRFQVPISDVLELLRKGSL